MHPETSFKTVSAAPNYPPRIDYYVADTANILCSRDIALHGEHKTQDEENRYPLPKPPHLTTEPATPT